MNMPIEKILAIDTSCDDTSAAVTIGDRVISNVISSQVELHKKWGGVVPRIAKRAHEEQIDAVVCEALKRYSSMTGGRAAHGQGSDEDYLDLMGEMDAVAVTQGPGLAPALEVGIAKAQSLVKSFDKSLIAVNHMEAHLLSPFAKNSRGNNPRLECNGEPIAVDHGPFLGLLVSGGHTQLVLMKRPGDYDLLGETLDDACGEAFDKVARMLNLGYPGGQILERLACEGDPDTYPLPVPLEGRRDLDFSYSGLKTAVLYKIREIQKQKGELSKQDMYDIAASFQRSAVRHLVGRLELGLRNYRPTAVLCGGGVVSNLYLRKKIRQAARAFETPILIPYRKRLFTDNAAMVGVCGYFQAARGDIIVEPSSLDRRPRMSF